MVCRVKNQHYHCRVVSIYSYQTKTVYTPTKPRQCILLPNQDSVYSYQPKTVYTPTKPRQCILLPNQDSVYSYQTKTVYTPTKPRQCILIYIYFKSFIYPGKYNSAQGRFSLTTSWISFCVIKNSTLGIRLVSHDQ